jgi:hypothetical protein
MWARQWVARVEKEMVEKIVLQGLRKGQWWMETGLKGMRKEVGKKGGCKS